MKIVGLCGGSGSGKSTVAGFFAELGWAVLNADEIYHELVSSDGECTRALAEAFGKDILNPDGSLNRRTLAGRVFSDNSTDEDLKKLNRIAHKAILDEVGRKIRRLQPTGCPAVLFDAPLLFESGFDQSCDNVICVTAPFEARVNRIIARDCISRTEAENRIRNQLSDEYLMSRSGYHIRNDGDLSALKRSAEQIAKTILNGEKK